MSRTNNKETERILKAVTSYYLRSSHFNGIRLVDLAWRLRLSQELLKERVSELIERDLLSENSGERHPNPAIKAFDPLSTELQLASLRKADVTQICLYPEPIHLKTVVRRDRYARRPFTLRLALGEPQLRHAAFDLSVLEFYRNDPRYIFKHDDVQGWISIRDEFYRRRCMPKRDQVLLKTFGFAYNRRMNRAAAAFLSYLSKLTPEHQNVWESKIHRGEYRLHPDYYRRSILGEWGERVSIFDAFLEEIRVINQMAKAMERPPFFTNEVASDKKPREFCFLIRPTSYEFNNFRQLLDKLLSDNINIGFFQQDVSFKEEIPQRGGRIEIRRKSSLRVLEEWLRARFRPADAEELDNMFSIFKSIRKARNRPAHNIDDNVFDQKYFREQRKLIIDAYTALRTLRLILANNPAVNSVNVPDWLYKGEIWDY
jgi:hypothetical protein